VDHVEGAAEAGGRRLPIAPYVQFGASPRATISLTLAAKAWAFLRGRGYVTPIDVRTLAHDVLRHRIVRTYEAEAEGITTDKIVDAILEALPVP
jgi:MoxR-like ATPase